ncbi:MAG: hypothetical protein Q9195_001901 [Heterodermia aff. obscurata]
MSAASESKRLAAKEIIDILHEIATLLNTHLDRQSVSLCVSLVENGVHPDAVATIIKQLRQEAAKDAQENPESD